MENKINFSPPSTREGKGVRFLLTTFSILLCSLQAVAQSLPRVAPEQVGMDDTVKDANETEDFLYSCYANVNNPIQYRNVEASADVITFK